jgi:DNA-binding NtrC family response regulator
MDSLILAQPITAQGQHEKPMDVIYIEDEEIEAQLLTIGLDAYGINVLHIPDARPETLAILETPLYQQAQAVFFDLAVGIVSGLTLARQMREAGDNRPFFLVTAANNPNSALLRQINMTFLMKPLDYDAIAKTLLALGA